MKKLLLSLIMLFCFSLNAQIVDAGGKKQGYWKKKDANGKLVYEGEFKDDKPVGYFKHYYPGDTAKRAITYFKDGGNITYTKMYHQITCKIMAEGKYIKEQKDSIWVFYDEAGVMLSKDNYKAGKKDGKCFVYLPDGAVAEEKIFKDGLEDGPFKQFFDGKLVKGEGKYVKGKLDGKASYYYPNGTVAASGIYKNGLKEGVWIYKDKDGKPKEKETFKNGVEVKPKSVKASNTTTTSPTSTNSVKSNTKTTKGK